MKSAARADRPSMLRQTDAETRRQLVHHQLCRAQGLAPICATVTSLLNALQGKYTSLLMQRLQQLLPQQQPSAPAPSAPSPADYPLPSMASSSSPPPPTATAGPLPLNPWVFVDVCPQVLPHLHSSQHIDKHCWQGLSWVAPDAYNQAVLQSQLSAFKQYCTAPIWVGRGHTPLSPESMATSQTKIMQYLGYIHRHMGVPQPNLSHVLNADLLSYFFAARKHSGILGSTMAQDVTSLKRVVRWWASQNHAMSVLQQVDKVFVWLGQLRSQLMACNASPAQDPSTILQRDQDRGDAAEFVQLLQSQLDDVQAKFSNLPPHQAVSEADARHVHDVLMAILLFGWVGCIRAKGLRTMIAPEYDLACTHSNCTSHGCKGNRCMVYKSNTFMVVIPHHKTWKSRGTICIVLPDDVNPVVSLYLNKALPVLQSSARDEGMSHPFMFMNMHGEPFTDSCLYSYWRRLISRWGGPEEGPHFVRHLFISERLSDNKVAGPSDAGAASVMGNSPKTWKAYYHRKQANRQAQESVNDMAAWRRNLTKSKRAKHAAAPRTYIELTESDDDNEICIDLTG